MSRECIVCGHPIDEDDVCCRYCGARVADDDDDYDEDGWQGMDSQIITTIIVRERTGQEIKIDKYPFVIGRSSSCNFTVLDNPAIGRKHLRVDQIGQVIFIEDLGSLNHTFIGGNTISNATEIYEGLTIQLADEYYLIKSIC